MPPRFAIRLPSLPLLSSVLLAVASALALSLLGLDPAAKAAAPPLPERLRDTGIAAPGVVSFSPQYPLWSDGAEKRRWLWLPPGRFIDGSRPDAWQFPPGTRLWKEFGHDGRPVETRFIERLADGSWRFASYVWNADGSEALLAPAAGIAALPVAAAPGGRYAVPSRSDCVACHGSAAVPVLGVGALQLSPDRDPLAANGRPLQPADVDLRGLVERGWLRRLPPALLAQAPRIPAATPLERAALGYLQGNCSHCHNTSGNQVPLALTLAQSVVAPVAARDAVMASMLDAPSRYRPPGAAADGRAVVPGDAQASVLAVRMQSRHPQVQMPPLGTRVPDPEGLALVSRWIARDLPTTPKEP